MTQRLWGKLGEKREKMVKGKLRYVCVATAVMLACGMSVAFADITSTSHIFNVSNTYPGETNYGSVDIQADDSAGTVEFSVFAENVQPLYGTLDNFGIQKFGFNVTDVNILSAIDSWTLPTGWTFSILPSNSLSMYGVFEATTQGTGGTRQNPLDFVLQLSDASLAVASNFVAPSSNGFLFAAHVAGYEEANGGSHWIAVMENGQIPAPGALALGMIGLVSLGFSRRRLAN